MESQFQMRFEPADGTLGKDDETFLQESWSRVV